jgi:uncharacterized protein YutE (UPF0331/DUF86 family)
MSPSKIREKVILERIDWVRSMISNIKSLPLNEYDTFITDRRNIASAESYLRRCLEALFDLCRHILAKAFGQAYSEYKEIANVLHQRNILNAENHERMKMIAGYRNRMVHYYNEITDKELFEICSHELHDIEKIVQEITDWIKKNPDLIDKSI